ncbi:MAG: helix-turn-helix domain-containing protein [Anaerolineae bacterium]
MNSKRLRRYDCQFGCSVEVTLDVISGKWKGVILFHLLKGERRFNELRRLLPDVTQRMLTLQLRELEEDGIVQRKVFQEVPPHVEYSLTEFGRTLEPMLLLMRDWGDEYTAKVKEQRSAAHARLEVE